MKKVAVVLFLAGLLITACGPSEEFVQLQAEHIVMQGDLDALENELSVASSETEAAQAKIANLEEAADIRQSELDDYRQQAFQFSKAIDSLICEKQIENMSYDAILESTSRLEAYVNGLPGVQYTSGGFRDTIYSNADSKIHAIRYNSEEGEQFIMTFLVFYDEFNWAPSTFFVDQQCWVDPPVRIPSGDTLSLN